MKISNSAKRIEPSLTRMLFNKAAQYNDVIDFTLGDPDLNTPESICNAAIDSILKGKTKYSANAGLFELRQVISDCIKSENDIYYNPSDEIIVTVGAMQGLYLSLFCILDEGDEVIIPAPYWVNYKHIVEMCKAKPVIIDTEEQNGFKVDINDLSKAVTSKTVAVILNSPNNPTGAVYDKETLEKICDLANEKSLYIVWDECYKSLTYDDEFVSILDCSIKKENVIVVNSCSKKWAMTGWRIGYVAATKELVYNMVKLQENMVACAPLPSQYAAIEAFKNGNNSTAFNVEFRKRRDLFVNEINKIDGLSCLKPKGTFYAMVNIKSFGLSSEEFSLKLLEQQHVAVVPGITYGKCSEGYVRVAYTTNEKNITEGIRRIKLFVDSLNAE